MTSWCNVIVHCSSTKGHCRKLFKGYCNVMSMYVVCIS